MIDKVTSLQDENFHLGGTPPQVLLERIFLMREVTSIEYLVRLSGMTRVADPDPVGSGFFVWIRCFYRDPDPVFKFLWIRIRFSNFSGSGSVFKISLDPDGVFKFLWIRIRF